MIVGSLLSPKCILKSRAFSRKTKIIDEGLYFLSSCRFNYQWVEQTWSSFCSVSNRRITLVFVFFLFSKKMNGEFFFFGLTWTRLSIKVQPIDWFEEKWSYEGSRLTFLIGAKKKDIRFDGKCFVSSGFLLRYFWKNVPQKNVCSSLHSMIDEFFICIVIFNQTLDIQNNFLRDDKKRKQSCSV